VSFINRFAFFCSLRAWLVNGVSSNQLRFKVKVDTSFSLILAESSGFFKLNFCSSIPFFCSFFFFSSLSLLIFSNSALNSASSSIILKVRSYPIKFYYKQNLFIKKLLFYNETKILFRSFKQSKAKHNFHQSY